MENLKFPESWEHAKRNTILRTMGLSFDWSDITEGSVELMAQRYEARIVELEERLKDVEECEKANVSTILILQNAIIDISNNLYKSDYEVFKAINIAKNVFK